MISMEGAMPTEVANEWEELVFDFGDAATGVYTAITLIYDLGIVGDGSADFTFLFDDMQLLVTSAAVELEALDIQYYPNPVQDRMTFTAPREMEAIRIYNLAGQQVLFERPLTNTTSIDLSFLNAGVYFIKVTMDGQEGSAKVIKH